MIKILLIMIVTAAVLVVTDDWVRAKWHPSEQTPHYSNSNWLSKADKLAVKRVHLDVWITDKYPIVMFYCVISPCGRRSLFSIND